MHGDMDRCMKKAVQECDVFIACLSPAYDKSDDCMNEISMAKNFKKKIIPAKVVDFDLKTTDNLCKWCCWFKILYIACLVNEFTRLNR